MFRIISILIMSVIISGCASTFLVYKDGKAQYFGSNRKEIQELLCKTGDLKRVLQHTGTINYYPCG